MTLWRIRRLGACLLAVALAVPGPAGRMAFAQGEPPAGPQPQVQHLPLGGIEVVWQAPEPALVTLPGGEQRVELAGFERLEIPGRPVLPFASLLVALPPAEEMGEGPRLEVLEAEALDLALPGRLEPAPSPEGVLRDAEGAVLSGAYTPAGESTTAPGSGEEAAGAQPVDSLAAAGMAQMPEGPVRLERVGILRGIHLARLAFYPALPEGGRLRVTTRVRIRLTFPGAAPPPGPGEFDLLQALVREAVANPAWAVPGAVGLEPASAAQAPSAGQRLAVEVEAEGLYQLTYAELAAAGFDPGQVDPALLRLTRAGDEVALEWEGDADGQFEPGERLLFFARPRPSRWTDREVFFLSAGDRPGLRIAGRSAAPGSQPGGTLWAEILAEENHLYTPECLCGPLPTGWDGDRWTWSAMQRLETLPDPEASSFTTAIDLPGVDPGREGQLGLWLTGYTDLPAAPDHRVQVRLNDLLLGEVSWDGRQAVRQDFSLPAGLLTSEENRIHLSMPGLPGVSLEGAWVDAFSLRYVPRDAGLPLLLEGEQGERQYQVSVQPAGDLRLYEVRDETRPVRLSGLRQSLDGLAVWSDTASGGPSRYWLGDEQSIAQPAVVRLAGEVAGDGGADLLIVAPRELVPGLDELVALRQGQGLRVAVEEVQDIYDSFGDGRPSPQAIRDYLSWAYALWQPRPLYVLLVGDGTADPKQHQAATPPTLIPPFLAEVDPWMGETAADNRFVTVEGPDLLPDMLLGRLPVNSLEELAAVVAKIVSAESRPPAPGMDRALLVADDPDPAGDFPALTETLRQQGLLDLFETETFYFAPQQEPAESFRRTVLAALDAGAGLVLYQGHASIHQWGAENFLHLDDTGSLGNSAVQPVVLEMTCVTAAFHVQGFSTLDEGLLRRPGGGARAVWGPTGLGVASGHGALASGFLEQMQSPYATLGTAAAAGKLRLVSQAPGATDLLDTYTLFGDPAALLSPQTRSYHMFLPWINS